MIENLSGDSEMLLFIGIVLAMLFYAGIKMYSSLVIASWGITVIITFSVFMYDLPINLFFFAVISTSMLVALAGLRFTNA